MRPGSPLPRASTLRRPIDPVRLPPAPSWGKRLGRPHWAGLAPALALALAGTVGVAEAQSVAQARSRLAARYAGQLTELARWCDGEGLADQARRTRAWLLARAERTWHLYIPLASEPVPEPAGPGDAGQAGQWEARFGELRRAQAEALVELARRASRQDGASLAYELVHEALGEQADHEAARRLLGYQLHLGRWLTPYEIGKARAGQVWDGRFGWLPRDHVPRYEAGERFYKGRWIPAAEDARLKSDIERGWDVATEHYLVRTNHSLEAGVRLAARLERLHRVWRQVFVRFFASDEQLARLFDQGAPAGRTSRRHRVVYFRSREEYVAALNDIQPRIGITTGYYLGPARKAYFFAGDDQDDANLYHEATHQLFNETRRVVPDIGREANFWIVEGIACYMESLAERDGDCTLGGPDAVRLRDARFRLLDDNFYVPLAEFVSYGMEDLQADERIPMLYTQASGLTHFLMHFDEGRYRDALVDYLVAVYTGRDRPATLAELTGKSYAELDGEYRGFIENLAPP